MATITTLWASFAGGELSPHLWGRVDLAKFKVGARTLLNWLVHPQGGASNRPGTRFIGEVDDSTKTHRLIPFQFRTLPSGQTYVLVFGHLTMQVAMYNGTTWGFVESSPGVRVTVTTPYAHTDLALLKYVQSADTMTLTHPNFAARKLTRSSHTAWTLSLVSFIPQTSAPTGLTASAGGTAGYIQVTAINDSTGEESLPSAGVGSSSGTAGSWTWNAVANCTNYNVYKKTGSVYGFVAQVQTTSWTDNNIGPDISTTPPGTRQPFGYTTFTGLTIAAAGAGYSSPSGSVIDGGKVVTSVTIGLTAGAITSVTPAATGQKISPNAYVTITDGAGSGAELLPQWADSEDGYGSYISGVTVVSGGAGYSTNTTVTMSYLGVVNYGGYAFTPTVVAGAITAVAVTRGTGAWIQEEQGLVTLSVADSAGSGGSITVNSSYDSGATSNPFCSTYFMQRQAYGATLDQPQTLWFTCVGAYANMNVSSPTKDSDAITRALVGKQVNEIRHLLAVGNSMLIFTSGAEWRCWPGPSQQALTPASCYTLPQTNHGSSHMPPLEASGDVLMHQEKGGRIRALRFDAIADKWQTFDMSALAQHLIYDTGAAYQLVESTYAAEPWSVAWYVRSDGILLGFTYMREHEVYAWHRHSTDGLFKSVCSITEPDGFGGYEDAVYVLVQRTIGGTSKLYLERMVSRTFPTIADAWFVDCGLQYSGTPVTTVSGLDHLEGESVVALADGSVVRDLTVTGGAVTLDGSYSKVTVGLPYESDGETLNLELQGAGGTIQGQMTHISQVTVRVKDTRGLEVGINQDLGPVTAEIKQRSTQPLGSAIEPVTGDYNIVIPPEWNRNGRLFFRQRYPLPATVLDLFPEVVVGD